MDLPSLLNARSLLTSLRRIKFSRRILLQGLGYFAGYTLSHTLIGLNKDEKCFKAREASGRRA
jgi:hypothetical protein